MTKFKHFETESGKIIMTSQFDGCEIADRILEGLKFQITVQPDGTLKSWVKPEDEDFFSDFNTEKFLKMALEYASEDFFYKNSGEFTDPNSGEACWLVSEDNQTKGTSPTTTPRVIKTTKLSDVIKNEHVHGPGCNHTQQNKIDQILGTSSASGVDSEVEPEKEKVIGKFKPKRKFLNFVIGKKGGIRYHSDFAFIDGGQLSGMLEDTIFKVVICDEGTINFEETDTNNCTDEMIQRLIDDIDSRDVTGYMNKYVVYGLEFKDEEGKKLYLEVEEVKPIDKLTSLFDSLKEEENKSIETMEEVKVSDKAFSILDALFASESEEELKREFEGENDEIKKPTETYAQQMMREAFEEMNREKIDELTDRIEKKEKDISQAKQLIKQHESNLKSASEDYRVLQSRLESLKPTDPANGYVFYVSPENKSGVVLDQSLQDVVKQISPLLKLKEDAVIDFLTKGFYTIKIAKKENLNDENLSIEKEIYEKINKLDVTGKMSIVGNGEFEYRGEIG